MSKTPEGRIKNQICEWLGYQKDCFFWVQATGGIYDPGRGIFRKLNGKHQMVGVADILGIYRGRPLAIEVKAGKNKPSDAQRIFLASFERAGGLAVVAYSVEDVVKAFEQVAVRES